MIFHISLKYANAIAEIINLSKLIWVNLIETFVCKQIDGALSRKSPIKWLVENL